MDIQNMLSRRGMILGGVAGLAAMSGLAGIARAEPVLKKEATPWKGLKVGCATYTLGQQFKTADEAIKAIQRVGLTYCSIKDFHLPFKSTTEERKATVEKFKAAGITPLSVGNVTLKNDEAQVRAMFEYTRDVGVPVMVCAPDKAALPICEKMVKEFGIKMAIHNHGPEDKNFPSPFDVIEATKNMDERIGCCIDVGHAARAGADPAEAIEKIGARVYDIHLKDLQRIDRRSIPIECGRGVLDLKAILTALLKINFQGHVGFEHEKDMKDVLPGLAEDAGYVRGLLAAM
ncbi:MAG: sugar phosphate isomerase/epimerase [Phycisphaerales bacterium]|nr:sugar phosphate isomerase/epimerase [Phycisphaerales bacterium]